MKEEPTYKHHNVEDTRIPDTVAAKAEFDTLFVEAINPKTSTGRLIYGFIRRWLRCYQLGYMYTRDYVLNEVFNEIYVRRLRSLNRTIPKDAFNGTKQQRKERSSILWNFYLAFQQWTNSMTFMSVTYVHLT
jgi:hypothetical protein